MFRENKTISYLIDNFVGFVSALNSHILDITDVTILRLGSELRLVNKFEMMKSVVLAS